MLQINIPLDELYPDMVQPSDNELRDMAVLDGVPYELLYLMTAVPNKRNLVAEQRAITALMQQDYDVTEIGRAAGLNKAQIDKRLKLVSLNRYLADAAFHSIIASSTAEAAVGLPPEAQARLARQLATTNKLTTNDVKQARQARREASLAAGSLFPEWNSAPDNWRTELLDSLVAALGLVPISETNIREAISGSIVLIQEG